MLDGEYTATYKGKQIYNIKPNKEYQITIEKGKYTYRITINYNLCKNKEIYIDKVIDYSSEISIKQQWDILKGE